MDKRFYQLHVKPMTVRSYFTFCNPGASGFILCLFLLLCFPLSGYTQRPIPDHDGTWVRDETNSLSDQSVQQLEQYLKHHRDSTSNQIAVYIIRSLEGEDIDDYAVKVFEHWKLGQQGRDNGVLILVSLEDRRKRIEVGYGLEGVLTDLQASRINRNIITPYFQRNDIENGIKAGVVAIVQTIKGEYVNDTTAERKRSSKKGSPLYTVFLIIMVIIFLSRRRGGGGGGGYWSRGGWIGPMMGGGFGSSSGSWSSGRDFGGGGFSGGGGSSDSW